MKRIFRCFAIMIMAVMCIMPVRAYAAESGEHGYSVNSDGRTETVTGHEAGDKTEITTPNISENKETDTQIRKRFSDGDVKISGIKTKKYTGTAITQNQIVVKYNGVKLKKDRDYTVTYRNNQRAGVAGVVIKGIGNYTGSVRKSFRIVIPNGKKYKVGSYEYKVTKSAANGKGTVTLMGAVYNINSKKYTSLKTASTVNIGGIKFKVTEIASGAFRNYICFKSIEIGSNVKKIGNEAFSGCWNVKTVRIGKDVSVIGNKAFYGCKKIKSVTVKTGKLGKVGAKAFAKIKPGVVIRVRQARKEKYKVLMKRGGMTADAIYRKL